MQPSPLIGYGEFGDGVGTIPFSDGTYGLDSNGEIKVVTEGEAKGADCIISDPDADSGFMADLRQLFAFAALLNQWSNPGVGGSCRVSVG